jgi:hypothetical protein
MHATIVYLELGYLTVTCTGYSIVSAFCEHRRQRLILMRTPGCVYQLHLDISQKNSLKMSKVLIITTLETRERLVEMGSFLMHAVLISIRREMCQIRSPTK